MKKIATDRTRRQKHGALLLGGAALSLVLACTALETRTPMPGGDLDEWRTLFGRQCTPCHGWTGAGDGFHRALLPLPPRNFRRERFKFISSEDGESPTPQDAVLFIRRGGRAGHMPAHPQLSDEQLNGLASYVREIHRMGIVEELTQMFIEDEEEFTQEEVDEIAHEQTQLGTALTVPPRPWDFTPSPLAGQDLYADFCASCHGPEGEGDGNEELYDELDRRIIARDLTQGDYRGGDTDHDLFLRIRCGLPGTAMSGLGPGSASDEEVWQLVAYLRRMATGR